MTETRYVSIAHLLTAEGRDHPSRPSSILTKSFCDLKRRFGDLSTAIRSMSSGYQEDSGYRDELHFHRTLDALTDEMQGVCRHLSTLRATRNDHLKLKISALLYLLPDDADTEVELAKSLVLDLEKNTFQFAAASSD